MTSANQDWGDQLNDYLDALAAGKSPASDALDPAMTEVVQRFFAIDDAPAPRAGRASHIWEDLMHQSASAGTIPQALTITLPSRNGRMAAQTPWIPRPATRSAPAHRGRRFAQLAFAALMLIALGFGFRALDPLGSGPEQPSAIPAAVAPDATPAVTTFPRANHPIIGAWAIGTEPGTPGKNWFYAIFDADGTYISYSDFSGVSIGTWWATGDRTVELVFVVQHANTLDTVEPGFEVPPSMLQGNPVTSWMTFEVDESENALTATGYYEPRDSNGAVMVHLEYENETTGDNIMTGVRLAPIQQPGDATPAA